MRNLNQELTNLIESSKVVLFMKGTKEFPMCGFSARVVNILNEYGVDFLDVNILEDRELAMGLKTFSDWPTFPQLYVNQEFVGGCDITTELHEKGKLKKTLNA
jgi:monothiol glutaredoxin